MNDQRLMVANSAYVCDRFSQRYNGAASSSTLVARSRRPSSPRLELVLRRVECILDEVRMSAARGRLADEQFERRREPLPLQFCWRGAALHAGGAGLICRGADHVGTSSAKGGMPPFLWFSSLTLLCAFPRGFYIEADG